MLPQFTPAQIRRFWAKVQRGEPADCWPWMGKRYPNGYGLWQIQTNHHVAHHLTHRVAYGLAHGQIPDDLLICHHCDNRPCCNPEHLYAGTESDNRNDAYRRGRRLGYAGPRAHGDEHPNRKHPERMARGSQISRKLTEQDVADIRARYAAGETVKALAAEFGLHEMSCYPIINRKTWRHVT